MRDAPLRCKDRTKARGISGPEDARARERGRQRAPLRPARRGRPASWRGAARLLEISLGNRAESCGRVPRPRQVSGKGGDARAGVPDGNQGDRHKKHDAVFVNK